MRTALLRRWWHGTEQVATVSGPPGWGKTTLLDQIEAQARRRDHAVVHVPGHGAGDAAAVLSGLLDPVGGATGPRVVLIDDVHEHAPTVVDLVGRLVLDAPPELSVAVAGRRLDGIATARLRAEGRVVEFDEAVLRLSASDLDDALDANQVAGDAAIRYRIHAAVDGWHHAANTVIDALVADAGTVPSAVLRSVEEELGAGLLDELETICDEEDVHFLERVAILETLHGEVCDAVAETTGSTRRLRRIAAQNVFVHRLDRDDVEFRMHSLLQTALLRRAQRQSPRDVRRGHERAARWFQDAGRDPLAVSHYSASGDVRRAADGLARWTYLAPSRPADVEPWVTRLQHDDLETYPPYLLATARQSIRTGDPERAEALVERLDRLEHRGPLPNGFSALSTAIRELKISLPEVQPGERARLVEDLYRDELHADGPGLRVLRYMAAHNLYLLGRFDETRRQCDAILLGHRSLGRTAHPDQVATLLAVRLSALLAHDAGRLGEARSELQRAVELHDEYGLGRLAASAQQVVDLVDAVVPDLDADERTARLHAVAAGAESVGSRLHALVELVRLHDQIDQAEAAAELLGLAAELVPVSDAPLLSERVDELAIVLDVHRSHDGGRIPPLTHGERSVLQRLPSEQSQAEIADALGLSVNTVKSHLRSVYQKLGVSSRSQAVARASAIGLLATVLPWIRELPGPDAEAGSTA